MKYITLWYGIFVILICVPVTTIRVILWSVASTYNGDYSVIEYKAFAAKFIVTHQTKSSRVTFDKGKMYRAVPQQTHNVINM